MRAMMGVLPWFLPGVAVAVAVGLLGRWRLGRMLGIRPLHAWALVVSLGIVLSATLTPRNGPETGSGLTSTCDFERVGTAPIEDLLVLNDTSLNVLLFVPLGLVIGALSASRRGVAVVVVAAASPFVIELAQLAVPWLNRACESADVTDNLTGLVLGAAVGFSASRILSE